MKERVLYLILKASKSGANLNPLVNEGLSYSNIADFTSKIILEGFLSYDGKTLLLSEKGEAKLRKLHEKYKKPNKEEWIRPLDQFRVKKLGKNDIFLPGQGELSF